MQFIKASKKTRNIADETQAAAPEKNAAQEVTPNPRTTRSSKTKKTESTETGPVKHRHNKVNGAGPEPAIAQPTTAKTLAAAAGSASVIMDPVGVVAPAPAADWVSTLTPEAGVPREVAHEEIAKLAYSYWIARGHSHGGAEEDWLRAERELLQRR